MVRGTVDLNAMLEAEADRLCNGGRYERESSVEKALIEMYLARGQSGHGVSTSRSTASERFSRFSSDVTPSDISLA